MRHALSLLAALFLPLATSAETGTARLAVMAVVPATCAPAPAPGVDAPSFACTRGTQASVQVTRVPRREARSVALTEGPRAADGATLVTVTYQP